MPRGVAGGLKLGHPKKVLCCFFFHANLFQRYYVRDQSSMWHGLLSLEVKVIVTYISWLRDFDILILSDILTI